MTDTITSRTWQETPLPDNPFRPGRCLCAGYDVYGDLLGKAAWTEYLFLLLKLEPPTPAQHRLLDRLAVALANPGPRDHGVQAAMASAAGGAGAAANLIAALAVGAGRFGGGRDVVDSMGLLLASQGDPAYWARQVPDTTARDPGRYDEVWPAAEHVPGFDPFSNQTIPPVRQALDRLAEVSPGPHLGWLQQHLATLEAGTGLGLAVSAVAAAALLDLDLDPEQGEMLYLLLRLPGAAAHALEQRERGWQDFPFYHDGIVLKDSPLDTGNKGEHHD